MSALTFDQQTAIVNTINTAVAKGCTVKVDGVEVAGAIPQTTLPLEGFKFVLAVTCNDDCNHLACFLINADSKIEVFEPAKWVVYRATELTTGKL